jgi:hypothetical protein
MALPKYLSWTGHGSSCGEPPGVFTGGTMHLFGLAADSKAMQALVDKFLNPVAGPKVHYEAFVSQSLLTILDIAKGTTAAEAIGWLPGRECALWIPLLETTLPELTFPPTLPPPPRVVMWSPYIFISYAIGMVTGRETWGWSKALADIDFPPPGAAAPQFKVSTVIFRELDATKPGGLDVLLKISGDGPLDTVATWPSLNDAAVDIIAKLTGLDPATVTSPFLASPDFPAIALKQYRDSSAPDLACYQAIVNSPVHIKNFGGGGFHGATFDLEITTCASHPMVEKFLGGKAPLTPSTVVPIEWAAFVKFDFDALAGSVIAKTT